MSDVYYLDHDLDTKVHSAFSVYEVKDPPSPLPDDMWSKTKSALGNDGCFSKETLKHLEADWMLINASFPMSEFMAPNTTKGTAAFYSVVHKHLKREIEARWPNDCQFVSVPKIWNERVEKEVESEHFYMLAKNTVQTWDAEKSDLFLLNEDADIYYIEANRVARSDIPAELGIWREASTGHTMCSTEFKELCEALGVTGVKFYKC